MNTASTVQDDETYFRNKLWMKTKQQWARFLVSGKEYNSTGGVCMSYTDKAEKILLSMQDGLHLLGHKGYRSARCTHGVDSGTWYCEFEIKDAFNEEYTKNDVDIAHRNKANVRLGWGTKLAELQAPIGYDAYGYGYRDVGGSKVHKSFLDEYGESYGPGDVIGMLIHFVDDHGNNNNCNVKINNGVNTSPNVLKSNQDKTCKHNTSHIRFFKNNIDQGIAFFDISRESLYFPTVSLYYNAYVKFNPGPNFKFPPQQTVSTTHNKMNGEIIYKNLKAYSCLAEGYVQKDMKEEEEKFDALVFNLNGTIVDNMEYQYESYRAVCSEYNLKIRRENFYAMFGMDPIQFLKKTCETQKIGLSQAEIENISNKRLSWYRMHCLGRQLGIHCVLKILKGAKKSGKLKLALVSNETQFVVNAVLKQLNVESNTFNVIINSQDYINQPPNPESFLLAAQKLKVAPSRIRAYGNSWYDIQAMKNAGMDAVDVKWLKGYPNQRARSMTTLKSYFLAKNGM